MKLTVFASARVEHGEDGHYWTSSSVGYEFWTRYLTVFDEVNLAVRVKTSPNNGRELKQVDGPNVRVTPLPNYDSVTSLVLGMRSVRNAVFRSIGPTDAVSFRMPVDAAGVVARRFAGQGRPYGVEVVGDPSEVLGPGANAHPLRPLLRRFYTEQQKRTVRAAAAAAYVTERQLQERYPADPVAFRTHFSSVILDDRWFLKNGRWFAQSSEKPLRIVFVGSLDQPYKGLDVLLDAVALSRSSGADLDLTVVGDGRLRKSMEDRADRLGIGRAVHFHGRVQGEEQVRRCLDQADLFILPSLTEGLPRAMIEAMARGLPCIGTSVGGIPELLTPEYLVPPNNAAALAAKIREVSSDAERLSRMSEANIRRSSEYGAAELGVRRDAFYQYLKERTQVWNMPGHERS